MRRPAIRWHDGEKFVQNAIEERLPSAESGTTGPPGQSTRRTLERFSISVNGAEALVIVKEHHTHSGPHRGREVLKRQLGFSPAQREWRALVDLHARGVAVPRPLAWGERSNADALVAMECFDGPSLDEVLASAGLAEQLEWIERVAETVQAFHATGYRHGDLHLGNLHIHQGSVRIIDLQRARRARSTREPLLDLAQLDFSLARRDFGIDVRRRLRRGLGDPLGLDAACGRFVRDFVRGRSRRELQIGRAWARWAPTQESGRPPGESASRFDGVRMERADESRLDRALREAVRDERPADRRSGRTRVTRHGGLGDAIIVKRNEPRRHRFDSLRGLRGSTARRDFERGQRLAFLGSLCATPLAALDEFRNGRRAADWLLLENVGSEDLDAYRPRDSESARRCLVQLAHWVAEWHAWGVDHRDLKASNIRVDDREGAFRFWLIDVGDIRLRRRVHDRARLRALVQLNASLADEAFDVETRRDAVHHYLDRLPIAGEADATLIQRIARQSLSRRHRWFGEGCALAAETQPTAGTWTEVGAGTGDGTEKAAGTGAEATRPSSP
jgi:tRNA A-37 threonylcarbamoyl transferase component Bud32